MDDVLGLAARQVVTAVDEGNQARRLVHKLALELVGMIETDVGYCGDDPVAWVIEWVAENPRSRFCEQAKVVAEADRLLGGLKEFG